VSSLLSSARPIGILNAQRMIVLVDCTVSTDIKVVAVDINGTLISGQYLHWTEIFEKKLGLQKRSNAPPLQWYEVQTGQMSFEEVVATTYAVTDLETLRDQAIEIYMQHLELREGCLELLDYLQSKYRLIICSDTSGVTKVIAQTFNLAKYFTQDHYSIDIGWMKSDREYWEHVLSCNRDASVTQFVMLGDNPSRDIYWPNVLGMLTIQIETTELLSHQTLSIKNRFEKSDYLVTSLNEIKYIL
jgi:FMN phosphatase YigB (HAD superfamily)